VTFIKKNAETRFELKTELTCA